MVNVSKRVVSVTNYIRVKHIPILNIQNLTDFESKQPKTQVLLSAMAHGREAPTTLVGFTLGCWELYDLQHPKLTYVTDWLERLDKKDPEALAMSLRRKVALCPS